MKTLEQLQQEQAEMIATAIDLGLELPAELMADFDVSTVGERVTKEIDKLIQAHRAGLDHKDEKALATPPEKAQKAPAKKAASKKSTRAAPAEKSDPPKAEGDTSVAKKSVAKKAKTAKKSAKKVVAKKAATGEARAPRSKFGGDQIVTWIAKENPCRKDTARWERYEKLRKASGKTVEKVLAAGVPSATLINASAAKVIKIA